MTNIFNEHFNHVFLCKVKGFSCTNLPLPQQQKSEGENTHLHPRFPLCLRVFLMTITY
jgi:hypothetical protein